MGKLKCKFKIELINSMILEDSQKPHKDMVTGVFLFISSSKSL